MPTTGARDLIANRWTPFVHIFRFEGQDMTGATFAGQVRDRRDGGAVRATLGMAPNDITTGFRLQSVANEDIDFGGDIGVLNVPVSTVSMRIIESVVDGMPLAGVSAEGSAGDDVALWWDMVITPASGDKYRALEGSFTVHAGVTQ